MKEQALLVTGLNKRMPDRKNKRIGFNKRTLCFRQDKARPVKGFVITNHEYIAV